MNNGMLGSPHQDVLTAVIGVDKESDLRLLEEIKSRAKGAFANGHMPSCESLYTKAISIQNDATLYSNRAMVRLKMGNNQGALEDSEAALKIDPNFIKGYYRKAMAHRRLEEFDKALAVCAVAQVKENKEMQQLAEDIRADKKKADDAKGAFKAEAHDLTIDRPVPAPTRVPLKPLNGDGVKKAESDNRKTDEKGDLRGYKTRADGATTSYFHMDISEEAKNLIGDIRPQKLETPVEVEVNATKGSVWNTGGTYESKSYVNWATEKLQTLFPIKCDLANLITCEVTFKKIENTIEIICNRGKRRHVNDLTFTFDWIIKKDMDKIANGTITFENDGDGDYTPLVTVDAKTENTAQQIVDMAIRHSGSSVAQKEILSKLKELDDAFRKC